MSEKVIAFAIPKIASSIKSRFPSYNDDELNALARTIAEKIDWNDSTLMHKDLRWIANFYANRICKSER